MATGSLYGSTSESTGLYGIGAASGGTYFEWFVFQDSATAPPTPTGGSWNFSNNTGTPPTGWVVSPPPAPVNQVWVSIVVVDSRNVTTLAWSIPGLMTGSGLPILSASGVPASGTGLNGQLYINTATTPQSLYFKQSGAWTQLSGSNLVDLVNNQTIGGVKTFTQTIQGSISGTAGNVSGVVAVANGGTGASTAANARTNLGLGSIATQNANAVAITGGSIAGITDLAVADGGTGASSASVARTNLGAVGLSDTQTLTNKTISGASNTLTNIPNSALDNDSVNVNGVDLTLGAVQTLGPNWILPSYAGNAGKVLAVNPSSSDVQWVSGGGVGSVTSVDVSGGTTGLTTTGGPITAAGVITLGGTLGVANGGTGVTTSTGTGNVVLSTAPTLTRPAQASYEDWTGISTPSYAEGRLWYDSTAKALTYFNDSPTDPVHIGQDLQVKVINNTGSTIANGSPVYITGTSSGQTYPNIALAKADVAATSTVIGLTNGAIANGAIGYVTSQGGIDNVNTGTFTVGQVLYLSPFSAGQLMNTIPPTGITVQVGVVTFVNSSTGRIYVKQTTPLNVPASIISGTVAIANGGTGATSFAAAGLATLTGTETLTNKTINLANNTLTGTASININGTVGATTPNTGSFTTLTTSSTVTHNAGTANGVAYLNGSKVLTTGSALTFDGTTLSAVAGIEGAKVTTAGNVSLYNSVASSITHFQQLSSAYSASYIQSALSGASSSLVFGVNANWTNSNAVEGMRLTSTGLGIGTSSPVSKLHVAGTFTITGAGQSMDNGQAINMKNTSGTLRQAMVVDGSNNLALGGTVDGGILFYTSAGNERARITAAGDFGIGTSSPQDTLDITRAAGTAAIRIASQGPGSLTWRLASQLVGVANAGFVIRDETNGVNRLAIDGAGNVGIGTSSPDSKLTVVDGTNSIVDALTTGGARTRMSSNASTGFSGTTTNHPFVFVTNATERARIDSSGNFGIGNASAVGKLEVYQNNNSGIPTIYARQDGTAPIQTWNVAGGTERARITSGGDLLVGTTNNNIGGTTTNGINATASGILRAGATDNASLLLNRINSDGTIAFFQRQGTTVGTISVTGSATAYNTSSDYRLKNTIAPMTGALAKVALLKPCTYKWNADGSDGEGFIAHELAEVVPQCVTGQKDAVDAEGKPQYQGIDTSFLVATLTAAIQEQQAIINSLKARLDAANL